MPLRINDAARNAALDALLALINGGSGPGVLRIYSGAQPATPATAPSGTLLAEFTLSDPAFAGAVAGSAALDVTPELVDTALATATAGWCRFLDSTEAASDGQGIIDGAVTATGGGGLITLVDIDLVTGEEVTITGGSFTMPAS